jgi:hypothetical protein
MMPAPTIIKCPITGQDTTITQLAKRSGIPRDCLRWRINRGKTGQELLSPINPKYQHTRPYKSYRQIIAGNDINRACRTPLAMPFNRIDQATHMPLDDNHKNYMKRMSGRQADGI